MSFVTILKQADIFYELSNTQLELVASICTDKTYAAGELVFEENTPGSELCIIAEGEVEIQVNPATLGKKDEEGGSYTIATLRRGQTGQIDRRCQPLSATSPQSGATAGPF